MAHSGSLGLIGDQWVANVTGAKGPGWGPSLQGTARLLCVVIRRVGVLSLLGLRVGQPRHFPGEGVLDLFFLLNTHELVGVEDTKDLSPGCHDLAKELGFALLDGVVGLLQAKDFDWESGEEVRDHVCKRLGGSKAPPALHGRGVFTRGLHLLDHGINVLPEEVDSFLNGFGGGHNEVVFVIIMKLDRLCLIITENIL